MAHQKAYGILVALVAAWCGLILVAPLLRSEQLLPTFSQSLYQFFSIICHQLDDRSFHLGGEKFAVCIRCSSIYFGFLIGALFQPLRRKRGAIPSVSLLFFASAPMVADVAMNLLGIRESDLFSRTFTGGLFGIILPSFIIPALSEAVGQFQRQLFTSGGLLNARKTK
ncbi:MAG TPA: DUF2085 domain-containing protein [Bacteroidota bacterium]|nr:DUF2085 domain-containing protein [Bacteroidota bacterium]